MRVRQVPDQRRRGEQEPRREEQVNRLGSVRDAVEQARLQKRAQLLVAKIHLVAARPDIHGTSTAHGREIGLYQRTVSWTRSMWWDCPKRRSGPGKCPCNEFGRGRNSRCCITLIFTSSIQHPCRKGISSLSGPAKPKQLWVQRRRA